MVENQFRAMEYIIIQLTLPNKTSGSVHPQTLLSLCPIFFSQCFPFQIGACWWIGHVVPIRKEILALCDFGAMCRRHLIPVPLKTTEQTRSKRRVCSESGYFSMLIFPIILAGDFCFAIGELSFWNPWDCWRCSDPSEILQPVWAAKKQVTVSLPDSVSFLVPKLNSMKSFGGMAHIL